MAVEGSPRVSEQRGATQPGSDSAKWECGAQKSQHPESINDRQRELLNHLLTGKPSPNIPAEPVRSTLVFVSEIAARY